VIHHSEAEHPEETQLLNIHYCEEQKIRRRS
jgi:hypothetical protein